MNFLCPLCGEGLEYPRADLPYQGPCSACNRTITLTLRDAAGPPRRRVRYVGRGAGQAGNSDGGSAALVCGILGLLFCGVLCVVAMVLGAGKKSDSAKAGFILGLIGTILWLGGVLVWFLIFGGLAAASR